MIIICKFYTVAKTPYILVNNTNKSDRLKWEISLSICSDMFLLFNYTVILFFLTVHFHLASKLYKFWKFCFQKLFWTIFCIPQCHIAPAISRNKISICNFGNQEYLENTKYPTQKNKKKPTSSQNLGNLLSTRLVGFLIPSSGIWNRW